MTNEEKIGDLINKYNNFELLINHVITNYYSPSRNEISFREILLNGTILGIGQKIKILANMEKFNDNKLISNLREIARIRNAVVHNNPYTHVNPDKNPGMDVAYQIEKKIDVMNSSGVIKTKDFEEEYDRFNEMLDSVVPKIQRSNLEMTE